MSLLLPVTARRNEPLLPTTAIGETLVNANCKPGEFTTSAQWRDQDELRRRMKRLLLQEQRKRLSKHAKRVLGEHLIGRWGGPLEWTQFHYKEYMENIINPSWIELRAGGESDAKCWDVLTGTKQCGADKILEFARQFHELGGSCFLKFDKKCFTDFKDSTWIFECGSRRVEWERGRFTHTRTTDDVLATRMRDRLRKTIGSDTATLKDLRMHAAMSLLSRHDRSDRSGDIVCRTFEDFKDIIFDRVRILLDPKKKKKDSSFDFEKAKNAFVGPESFTKRLLRAGGRVAFEQRGTQSPVWYFVFGGVGFKYCEESFERFDPDVVTFEGFDTQPFMVGRFLVTGKRFIVGNAYHAFLSRIVYMRTNYERWENSKQTKDWEHFERAHASIEAWASGQYDLDRLDRVKIGKIIDSLPRETEMQKARLEEVVRFHRIATSSDDSLPPRDPNLYPLQKLLTLAKGDLGTASAMTTFCLKTKGDVAESILRPSDQEMELKRLSEPAAIRNARSVLQLRLGNGYWLCIFSTDVDTSETPDPTEWNARFEVIHESHIGSTLPIGEREGFGNLKSSAGRKVAFVLDGTVDIKTLLMYDVVYVVLRNVDIVDTGKTGPGGYVVYGEIEGALCTQPIVKDDKKVGVIHRVLPEDAKKCDSIEGRAFCYPTLMTALRMLKMLWLLWNDRMEMTRMDGKKPEDLLAKINTLEEFVNDMYPKIKWSSPADYCKTIGPPTLLDHQCALARLKDDLSKDMKRALKSKRYGDYFDALMMKRRVLDGEN